MSDAAPRSFPALRHPGFRMFFICQALAMGADVIEVGSSRVDLQACKLEYSIVSPK